MPAVVVIIFLAVQLIIWPCCMLSSIVSVSPAFWLMFHENKLAGGLLEAVHFRFPRVPLITSTTGPSIGFPVNERPMCSGGSDQKKQ